MVVRDAGGADVVATVDVGDVGFANVAGEMAREDVVGSVVVVVVVVTVVVAVVVVVVVVVGVVDVAAVVVVLGVLELGGTAALCLDWLSLALSIVLLSYLLQQTFSILLGSCVLHKSCPLLKLYCIRF